MTTSKDRQSDARRVGRRLPSAEEILQAIDDDLEPLENLLVRVRTDTDKSLEQLGPIVAVDRTYRPARQLLGEFQDLSERIQRVSGGFDKLTDIRDRLERSIDAGELKQRDLDAKTVHIYRLIDRYDERIRELDTSHREFATSVKSVISSAQAHHAESAAAALAASEREAQRVAKREAEREARRREREEKSRRTTRSGTDRIAVASARPTKATSDADGPSRARRAEATRASERSTALIDSGGEAEDDESETAAAASTSTGSWIPMAGGGLALVVVALVAFAARSSNRRELARTVPEPAAAKT